MRWSCSFPWLGLVILAVNGCYPQTGTGPEEVTVRPVTVLKVQAGQVPETLTLIGSIEPWQEATLYFEVAGVVAEVFVEEGDWVKQGDPIAQLVLDDYQLALSEADAQLEAAQARLNLLNEGTRKEDLAAAEANHARTSARAAYWTGELTRNRKLFERGVISASELEQIRREHNAAVEEERWAKARLERAVAGPRTEEIEAANAEVIARTQAVALAKRQLGKATLKAPFDGYVEKRLLDVGAYVNVFPTGGVPVVHLVDLEKVDAVVAVPEALLARFALKQPIEISSAVDPQLRAEGEVSSLGRVADRDSGTYRLRARLDNPDNADGRFTARMVITAKTTSAESRRAVRIPLGALHQAYGQPPHVLLVNPKTGRVVARQVRLGPVAGEKVEIAAGLAPGALLIVGGQDRVVVGDRVKY